MKLEKTKKDSLMGYTEVRYTEVQDGDEETVPFAIVADPSGVRFEGNSGYIETLAELELFAKKMSDAWVDFNSLKPKLERSLSGH